MHHLSCSLLWFWFNMWWSYLLLKSSIFLCLLLGYYWLNYQFLSYLIVGLFVLYAFESNKQPWNISSKYYFGSCVTDGANCWMLLDWFLSIWRLQAVMKSYVATSSDPGNPEKFLAYMAPAPGEVCVKCIYGFQSWNISCCT